MAYTAEEIAAAEQAARQAWLDGTTVDPSVNKVLFSTNDSGQVVRNSDGYTSGWSTNDIQSPEAQQYYAQNPQELFAFGALSKGPFKNSSVRNTNRLMGQMTPDQWYKGYNSSFANGWDSGGPMMQHYGGVASGQYGGQAGGLNPYQTEMFNAVTNQVTDNLNRNILPGLSSAAIASGGFGGSRQGVLEANALNDANRTLSNSLSNIQYTDWNNYQNRLLQNKGLDNSYNLGMGNLGLGFYNADNNFYTAQRGQDLQSAALGASLFNQGNSGFMSQGQGLYDLGLAQQTAPFQTIGNFNNAATPYTGFGSTTQNTSGNTGANMLGGALGALQMYKLF